MAESVLGAFVGELVKYLDQLSGKEGISPFLTEQQVTDLKQELQHIQSRQLESEDGAFIAAEYKHMLIKLKGALYRLEDLLDEVVMAMAMKGSSGKLKLTNIVSFCSLVSCSNSTSPKENTAAEAEAILQGLQFVSSFMREFNIRPVDPFGPAALTLSEEKNPMWCEEEVICRDGDRKMIEERISRSDDLGDSVAVIPIIGISGSGKTVLARAVFRDDHVQKNFELKGWAFLSHLSSFEDLLKTILESITGLDCPQLGLAKLKSSLLDAIFDKKYLLVLDDARDQHCDALHNLTSLLKEGQRGSRILLTSRSRSVAQLIGTVEPHELGGLPDHHAWDLFKGLAFRKGRQELAGIGRDIVRECRNVPLVIRIIAGLLYSKQTLQEWEDFKNNDLKMINGDEEMEDVEDHTDLKKKEWDQDEDVKDPIVDEQREDVKDSKPKKISFKGKERVVFEHSELGKKDQDKQRILAAFRVSYKHLPPKLKMCFIYCSLFPKNYELNRQDLIYFWMAQGFIEPSTESDAQRPEDVGDGVGHGLFMELLRRCFFKDVKMDEYGKIISCKMHDAAHDLAQVEASFDCSTTLNRCKTFWHASFMVESSWEAASWWRDDTRHLRSLLLLPGKSQVPFTIQDLNQTLPGLRCLRTLDLVWANCESLPNSIGDLKHLRYLRLGGALVSLPESIARVVNLQTLDLQACHQLRRLPASLNKLAKLRHLKAKGTLIDDMPPDFGLLTSLQTLDLFVVGGNNGLDVLNNLSGIAGDLEIRFKKHRGEDGSLDKFDISSRNLTRLILEWSSSYEKSVANAEELRDGMVLQRLQPPSSVKSLEVRHWKGVNFPKSTIALAELVSLKINGCSWCQYLPPLGQIPTLKSLELANLDNLEYIEHDGDDEKVSTEEFFPLLENLKLVNLLKLKGWSTKQLDIGGKKHKKDHWTLSFTRLSELTVRGCPELMSMPSGPQLWSLSVSRIHKKLLRQLLAAKESPAAPSSSSPPPRLSIESVHNLDSLSINIFSIESLSITECQELTKLAVASVKYLPYLEIRSCRRLKNISEALQQVDHLDKLVIDDCEQINWGNSLEEDGWLMPGSLRSLELRRILKLKALPKCLSSLSLLEELRIYGLRNLTALPEYVEKLDRLRQLHIQDCLQLTVLPEQIDDLYQLRQLCIQHCPQLKALPKSHGFLARLQKFWIRECHSELVRRCRKPDGEYWPLIQNIPLRSVQ